MKRLIQIIFILIIPLISFSQLIQKQSSTCNDFNRINLIPIKPFNPTSCAVDQPEDDISLPSFQFYSFSSPDVIIQTGDEPSSHEISVAINPLNDNSLVEAHYRVNADEASVPDAGLTFGSSGDYGKNWSTSNPMYHIGDPSVVISGNEVSSVAFIRWTRTEDDTKQRYEIRCIPNMDNSQETVIYDGNAGSEEYPAYFKQDKPHINVDLQNNILYCVWEGNGVWEDPQHEFYRGIWFSKSTDGGISWPETNIRILNENSDNFRDEAPNIQVGSEGELYVCWTRTDNYDWGIDFPKEDDRSVDETRLMFSRSLDGGQTWSTEYTIINNLHGIGNYGDVTCSTASFDYDGRLNSFPSMCVDHSRGPHNGRIYIVWASTNKLGDPPDMQDCEISTYFIFSDDRGRTWKPIDENTGLFTPTKLIPENIFFNEHSFFPWISCDSESGVISVVLFTDYSSEGSSFTSSILMSNDYGTTWDYSRISDHNTPSQPGQEQDYGEYFNVCSQNGIVYATFPVADPSCTLKVYTSPFYPWGCIENYPDQHDVMIEGILPDKIKEWMVTNSIRSHNIICTNGTAIYNAGESISFLPGVDEYPFDFHAKLGSYVHAYIKGCDDDLSPIILQPNQKYSKIIEDVRPSPEFKIYPNPNHGEFFVEIENQMDIRNWEISVLNVTGKIIYEDNFDDYITVNLTNCSKGLYLVRCKNIDCTLTKKIIIQ